MNKLIIAVEQRPDGAVFHIIGERCREYDHRRVGLLLADIARQFATALKLDERKIFEWLEKERIHQTTPITGYTLNE